MSKDSRPNAFEQAGADVMEYARLRVDGVKLGLVDDLSTFSSTIFSVLLCVLLAGMAVLFLAAAAVWGLMALTGSFLWAVLIVAFIFIIAAIIVFAKRERLIVNPMVRIFSRMMFEKKHKIHNYE